MYIAYNKGVEYLTSHNVADIQDILIKEMGFSKELAPKAKLSTYTKAVAPTIEDLTLVTNWLSGKKLIDPNFNPSSLIDSQYLEDDQNK